MYDPEVVHPEDFTPEAWPVVVDGSAGDTIMCLYGHSVIMHSCILQVICNITYQLQIHNNNHCYVTGLHITGWLQAVTVDRVTGDWVGVAEEYHPFTVVYPGWDGHDSPIHTLEPLISQLSAHYPDLRVHHHMGTIGGAGLHNHLEVIQEYRPVSGSSAYSIAVSDLVRTMLVGAGHIFL